jgi:hypothetical protein
MHALPIQTIPPIPHPQGDIEAHLSAATQRMLTAFEALLEKMLSTDLPAAAAAPADPAEAMFSPLKMGLLAYRARVSFCV